MAARRVLDLVLPDGAYDAPCYGAVVEHNYIDHDFAASYSRLYARAFGYVRNRCMRVHFFGSEMPLEALIESDKPWPDYRGFSVLWPVRPVVVGRTVLRPPDYGVCARFCIPRERERVNLAGFEYKIVGVPFMQQDVRVARCAEVALWTVVRTASALFDAPRRLSIAEIAEAASQPAVFGRSVPSPGLSVGQMHIALGHLGLDSINLNLEGLSGCEVAEQLVPYLDSQIPVILYVKPDGGGGKGRNQKGERHIGHALTAVGYIDSGSHGRSQPDNAPYRSYSAGVSALIVHDDQSGPYRLLKLFDTPGMPAQLCHMDVTRDTDGKQHPLNERILSAIVPIPGRVYNDASDAWVKVEGVLEEIYRLAEKVTKSGLDACIIPTRECITLRTFLAQSNDWKRFVQASPEFGNRPKALYRVLPLPRFVWLTEISEGNLTERNGADVNVLGEILTDPASSPETTEFLTIRLGRHFSVSDPYSPQSDPRLDFEDLANPYPTSFGFPSRRQPYRLTYPEWSLHDAAPGS
jgi:hypothetical protein